MKTQMYHRSILIGLMMIAFTSCLPDQDRSGNVENGIITFAQWMKEASLHQADYDAVAFIREGTCGTCQSYFDTKLKEITKRVLIVSCDPTTIERYRRIGKKVHFDSLCRHEYVDVMKHQTVVFFMSSDSASPSIVTLDPGNVSKVVERLK